MPAIDLVTALAAVLLALCVGYIGGLLVQALRDLSRARALDRADLEWFNARLDRLAKPLSAIEVDTSHTWNGFRKFEVRAKVLEADGVCSFYLAPHDGQPLPMFRPGQYLTIQVRTPSTPEPVLRCYSLSDSPTNPDYYRISIKRIANRLSEDKSVSAHLHRHLNVGDPIDVKAPAGNFHLEADRDGPVVFIAGGIGITPFLSMLNFLTATNDKREVWLFYGVGHAGEHLQRDYLRFITDTHRSVNIRVFYSNPRPEDDDCQQGHVTIADIQAELPTNNYDFYICGPPSMLESISNGLTDWGVPDDHVRVETFGAESLKQLSMPAIDTPAVPVHFARTDKTFEWSAAHGSLLDLAEANSIPIYSGCRAGNCGSCMTTVREGTYRYLKRPGVETADGSCLACISVPTSALVVDA